MRTAVRISEISHRKEARRRPSLLDDGGPTPAHLMESAADSVPQNTFRVCQLGGCDRPVTRRRRKYCSRHNSLNVLDHVQTLYDRPEVRAAWKLAEERDKLYCIVAPVRVASEMVRHAESMMVRSSLAEERMWRAIFSLPRPLPLSRIKLEAREAWERFAEGDAEPLDLFIKERLGLLRNHKGPVPDNLRERVWNILDNCFAPVSFYRRGEWFFLDQEEVQAVATLLNEHWEWFPSVERAMVSHGHKEEVLREELPGATLAMWEELQWTENPSTLLNAVSNGFRKGGGERDRLEAKGQLVDAEPDQFARANVALDMFMLREELRSRLPQRQYQVVDLRLAGFTQAEIATKLDIDEGTVKTHVSRSKPVVDEILAR